MLNPGNISKKRRRNKKEKGNTITIEGKKFNKIRTLGEGAYGKVFKVKDDDDNFYAVKKVQYKEHEGVYPDIIKEMDFLRRFSHHPNIIDICGWKWDNQVFAALMEYGGSPLHRFIEDERFDYRMELLPEVLWQILNGLVYLHKHNVVHRDIKPDNILIDEWIVEKENPTPKTHTDDVKDDTDDGVVESVEINIKLVDFGLSKTLVLRKNTPKTSTLWYRAPENLAQLKVYDCKIDIWAVGCIIYEYYTGDVLFRGNVTKDTLIRVLSTFGPNIPEDTLRRLNLTKDKLPTKWRKYKMKEISDEKLKILMMRCLELNPDKRPSALELLHDEYFTSRGYQFDENSIQRIELLSQPPDDQMHISPLTTQSTDWLPLTKDLHTEIIEWMFHISSIKYIELNEETIFLAIEIFERVIRKWSDPIKNISEYKYISLACLDIASKIIEVYSIELEWVYEYNNKEFYKEQKKKYEENPLAFKSPPKPLNIHRGDLKAFVIRINRYEQRILYLLDFYIYTQSAYAKTQNENPEKHRNEIIKEAKKQVFDNIC